MEALTKVAAVARTIPGLCPALHRRRTSLCHLKPRISLTWPRVKCSNFRDVRVRSQSSEDKGSPIRTVSVQDAQELLHSGHRYLDVRTAEEFAAGHIEGAVNIPYMYKGASGMAKNPEFVAAVGDNFGKDDEVVVGCQMGKRSQMAAAELVSAGFMGVADMAGGYSAWVQSGLPTTV